MIYLETPLTVDKIKQLKAGDEVFLSGTIYTGRDAAHKRLIQLLDEGKELPFNIQDQTIFYVGPTPSKPGQVFGSGGPTTSGNLHSAIFSLAAYTVILCFSLFKTGTLAKSIFNAH